VIAVFCLQAQEGPLRNLERTGRNLGGNRMGNSSGGDSLEHRDKFEDSITIYFRYLDSSGIYKFDSSMSDFSKVYPVPPQYVFLGNTGNASHSLLFEPLMKAGWDAGFHAFDVYRFKLGEVPFYNTTRPYTELGYLLGTRSEQMINVTHTQNIKPNWNASLRYRLINAPGIFKNQKTNHNNYLITSLYQANSKRYTNYFVILANKLQSSENGGIKDDTDYLENPDFKDRFNIPTKLGGDPQFGRDFFNTKFTTSNINNDFTAFMRQQYDLGRKDSLVTDSTVIPLFYPRLRFEYSIRYNRYKYRFEDDVADSVYYKNTYGITLGRPTDTLILQDSWREIINDFSIYQFPDANNLKQFFKAGVSVQNLHGEFKSLNKSFYNFIGHAEYRNKTRNGKWDMEALGKLYFNGLNAGDYDAFASLQRLIGKKLGFLKVGFENVNRTPSFIFDNRSSFYLDTTIKTFKKENSSHIFASYFLPSLRLRLGGDYFLISNYSYIDNYYQLQQQAALFNYLRLSLLKHVQVGKKWNWYIDLYLQKETGNPPVNVPLFFTRQRFAYEGNLGFKNLDIAIGTEVKYYTPYKANGYSPALANFYYQDSATIRNRPEITAYMHFRIRTFRAYIRAENLNTVSGSNGFGFTKNSFAAPGYPTPGLIIRLGIFWNFVN